MQNFKSEIIKNEKICDDFFRMRLKTEGIGVSAKPGEFFTARVSNSNDTILRRPFAFSDLGENYFEFIYKNVGTVTEALSHKENGELLDILGPLGNGFELKGDSKLNIVIAGGVGIGPMLFTADSILKKGRKVMFVFGTRSKNSIPDMEQFRKHNPIICTDDGSEGFHGTVIDYLRKVDSRIIENSRLLTCGPYPMQKAAHNFASDSQIECQVSMEEMMACGVGVCMGCAIEIKTASERAQYARVCKEGPVFNSGDIEWM